MLGRLLPTIRSPSRISVRVHPDLIALVQRDLTELDGDVAAMVDVVAAPLERGDVKVSWENGSLTRDIRQIAQAIQDALGQLGLRHTSQASANTPAEARPKGAWLMPNKMDLTELADAAPSEAGRGSRDLEAVYDIPVTVSAVLGKSTMQVSQLLKLGRGAVVELDRKLGEAIDIYVNNRLVARGEVVLVDETRLGVTMTEIVKSDRA